MGSTQNEEIPFLEDFNLDRLKLGSFVKEEAVGRRICRGVEGVSDD